MLKRKTQYAWMAVGGLICLFGLVLACKFRDGNKAIAQSDKDSPPPLAEPLLPPPLPPTSKEAEKTEPMPSFPPMLESQPSEPEMAPPSKTDILEKLPKSPPMKAPSAEAPKGMLVLPPTASAPPSETLPASFGPNTPTVKEEKKDLKSTIGSFFSPKPTAEMKVPTPANVAPPPPPSAQTTPKGSSMPASPAPIAAEPTPSPIPAALDAKVKPASYAPPVIETPPSAAHEEAKAQPGEPPLAPAPGPVQLYHTHASETLQEIARRTLGSSERWTELHKLNPTLKTDAPLGIGTTVRLPADACLHADDGEPVKPLPALRRKPVQAKAKTLPLTGTYQCSLDEKGRLTLPRALRDQLSDSDTVLLSPGSDKCLWLTNQPHLERLGERLEQSRANENDVRDFKRLYFAQTEKLPVNDDGRVVIPERLAQFAGLRQEVVLVGIDDHFEMWDATHWRQYTQQKSAASRATAMTDKE